MVEGVRNKLYREADLSHRLVKKSGYLLQYLNSMDAGRLWCEEYMPKHKVKGTSLTFMEGHSTWLSLLSFP